VSNKDKRQEAERTPFNSARLHDGWAYVVTFRSGETQKLYDRRNLGQLLADFAASPKDSLFVFSGASVGTQAINPETGQVSVIVSALELAGAIRPEDVSMIRYAGWRDESGVPVEEIRTAVANVFATLETLGSDEDEGDEEEDDEGDEPSDVSEAAGMTTVADPAMRAKSEAIFSSP
jgi:hypothetical protein